MCTLASAHSPAQFSLAHAHAKGLPQLCQVPSLGGGTCFLREVRYDWHSKKQSIFRRKRRAAAAAARLLRCEDALLHTIADSVAASDETTVAWLSAAEMQACPRIRDHLQQMETRRLMMVAMRDPLARKSALALASPCPTSYEEAFVVIMVVNWTQRAHPAAHRAPSILRWLMRLQWRSPPRMASQATMCDSSHEAAETVTLFILEGICSCFGVILKRRCCDCCVRQMPLAIGRGPRAHERGSLPWIRLKWEVPSRPQRQALLLLCTWLRATNAAASCHEATSDSQCSSRLLT